ncbi:hypothetical protein E1A91_A09G004900v1, partial [Gossypium mustelinum]
MPTIGTTETICLSLGLTNRSTTFETSFFLPIMFKPVRTELVSTSRRPYSGSGSVALFWRPKSVANLLRLSSDLRMSLISLAIFRRNKMELLEER